MRDCAIQAGLDTKLLFIDDIGWKMILFNKAILPILWQLYPDCPYILPAYFEAGKLADYVKKPVLSREGTNINLLVQKDLFTGSFLIYLLLMAIILSLAVGSLARNRQVWVSVRQIP